MVEKLPAEGIRMAAGRRAIRRDSAPSPRSARGRSSASPPRPS
jgi:hypothetical protein